MFTLYKNTTRPTGGPQDCIYCANYKSPQGITSNLAMADTLAVCSVI